MTDKMKPCPFCGGDDLGSGGDDKVVGYWCKNCQAVGPNHYGKHEWNTRADAEALKAADEKLAKIHAVSMAYAEWVGEVSEILEEMCLDPEDDDHARVIQLLCQAEAGLAKEALAAYNAKRGERE